MIMAEVISFVIVVILLYTAYRKTNDKNILYVNYIYIGICLTIWLSNYLGV